MKRLFKIGKRRKAFSMAEMLVVMLILAIVLIAATPVAVRRVKKDSVRPEHGSFECYWDGDQLYEVERNAVGESIVGNPLGERRINRTAQGYCDFTPKRGAMFFTVNAVGGGSPGSGDSAFSNLPSSGYGPGIDYTNTFYKFNSFLIDPYSRSGDDPINFNEEIAGRTDIVGSPAYYLNSQGVKLYSILRSRGGDFSTGVGKIDPCTSGGAAYLVKTRESNSPLCLLNPNLDYDNYTYDSSSGKYLNKFMGMTCYSVQIIPGSNPGKGKSIWMLNTLRNGEAIKSSSHEGEAEPYFVVGNNGCQVTKGENGKFRQYQSCSVNDGQAVSYDGSTCSGYHEITSGNAGPYAPNRETFTTIDANGQTELSKIGFVGNASCSCYWSSPGTWTGAQCGSCTGPTWVTSTAKDATGSSWKYWYLYVMGNFILASEKSSNGLNFYAQAGSPGESRVLYVSRFRRGVRIIPGRPVLSNEDDLSGRDTVICYPGAGNTCSGEGAVNLLTVPGGKRPSENSDSFIMGSLFPLGDSAEVGAYDTKDNSSLEKYGNYFLSQSSNFVYPVPGENPIPENVGRGGNGAYTIYRKTGISNAYQMRRPQFTSAVPLESNSEGNNPSDIDTNYTCQRERISGVGWVTSGHDYYNHRCLAGDGFGGAVVLTW